MPRNKDVYNDSFDIFKDSKEKERYKYRKCGKNWAKNETRLQEHYNSCILTDNEENRIFPGFKCQYQTTIKWAKSILEKCKEIISYFRSHQTILAALRRLQIEKYGQQIALVSIIETQWGSAFECMDHLLRTKLAIKSILAEDNLRIDSQIQILIINDSFWKDLKYLCDLLKPFLMFIHLLEQDNPLLL
ncbi:4985_t:CDS:2, partial [Racocetra fulgida]